MRILKTSAVVLALSATTAWAQHAGHHQAVSAADLKWAPVPSLPKGAQIAVIEGPMSQAVPFIVRLKFPANYAIPPHTPSAVATATDRARARHRGACPASRAFPTWAWVRGSPALPGSRCGRAT